MISLLTYSPGVHLSPWSPRPPPFAGRLPGASSSRAVLPRYRRRSSPTCATRCLPKSSSPATCSAPRTRSRRATACRGSWRAMRCARSRRKASPRSRWARAAARGWRAATRSCSPRRSRCSSTLTGVGPSEIMDAQRAIECLAAELAAENATDADLAAASRRSIADAEASMGDVARFHRSSVPNFISRWPRPRTTACWWCSSSRCSTCHGRGAIQR